MERPPNVTGSDQAAAPPADRPAGHATSAPRGSGNVTDHLANERTFLAWVRSAVAIMALGFVVSRFGLYLRELAATTRQHPPASSHSAVIGAVLVALGVAMVVAALLRYLRNQRLIEAGNYTPSHGIDVALATLVAAGGMAMLVLLIGGA